MKRSMLGSVNVLVGLSLITVLSACSPTPSSPMELTTKDSGSHRTLAVGQQLTVSLDSNPSTGYRWALDGALPGTLQQVGAPKYTDTSHALGGGGTEVWTFKAIAKGSGSLKLKYWRSFEPTATPPDSFELAIDVR